MFRSLVAVFLLALVAPGWGAAGEGKGRPRAQKLVTHHDKNVESRPVNDGPYAHHDVKSPSNDTSVVESYNRIGGKAHRLRPVLQSSSRSGGS
jgi:hypothetical protein